MEYSWHLGPLPVCDFSITEIGLFASVLAAAWSILYEALICGTGDRFTSFTWHCSVARSSYPWMALRRRTRGNRNVRECHGPVQRSLPRRLAPWARVRRFGSGRRALQWEPV